jgi:hypothetical protein
MRIVALDPGFGAVKVWWEGGALALPSAVAVDGGRRIAGMPGLRTRRPPLEIVLPEGRFFVGEGAHDWGRPVENLDFERLTGSPELKALFAAAMTAADVPADAPLFLVVGLPVAAMAGPEGAETARAVRSFLAGSWSWEARGKAWRLEVREALATGQPVGALMDYFLDMNGRPVPERKAEFSSEIGILNIGMNTLDLLVARGGELVQRLTGGETLGVRRLLALLNPDGLYTLAELDARLRRKELDVRPALPIWTREVLGFIERQWGRGWRRFARIIAVGGGALLLSNALTERFEGKLYIPDDPILATARGLFKLGHLRRRR